MDALALHCITTTLPLHCRCIAVIVTALNVNALIANAVIVNAFVVNAIMMTYDDV